MNPYVYALLLRHGIAPDTVAVGENRLLPWLLHWLLGTGRLRSQTRVAYEVPIQGRRVDVALLTSRGVTTAFELKIGGLQRAIEQAAYNKSSFDRSWVVTGNRPKGDGLLWAQRLGIGVVLIQPPRTELIVLPGANTPNLAAARRLRAAIANRAAELVA